MNNCINVDDSIRLDSLLRHVMPVVSKLPYEMGVDLLRQSFTTFARKTQSLAVQIDITPQKGVVDYEIKAPKDYEIYLVREAGYTGRTVTLPQVNYWYVSWGRRFAIVSNKHIIFKETPVSDSDNPFGVIATVIPNECINTIPREISVPFGLHIAKGAIAEALLMKNRAWYDPNLAKKYERDFNVGMADGKNLQITNRGAADMNLRRRRWI